MSDADRWLAEREDDLPGEMRRELDRDEEGGGVPETLVERGRSALAQAGSRDPADREGAYRLLAADAYLTFACEAAAEAPDPGAVLERILERLAADAA